MNLSFTNLARLAVHQVQGPPVCLSSIAVTGAPPCLCSASMKSHVTAEPRFASLRSQRFPNWAASQPRLEVFHFISVMETVKFRYHWQNVMFANVLQPSAMYFPLNSEKWQFINYHIFSKICKDGTGLPTESNLSLTLANFPRKELGLGENWNLFHTCMLPFSLDPHEMWLPSHTWESNNDPTAARWWRVHSEFLESEAFLYVGFNNL